MMMSRKAKSIWAAILCLTLLFTELPFTQLSSVGTALAEEEESLQGTVPAEEGELLQGTVLTEEAAEAEFLGDSGSAIVFTVGDGQLIFYEEELKTSGYLDGLSRAVYYNRNKKEFSLEKDLEANIWVTGGMNCRISLGQNELIGTDDTSVMRIDEDCNVTVTGSAARYGRIFSALEHLQDEGGVIFNEGTLDMKNVYIGDLYHNRSTEVQHNGGGLSNHGTASLKNVRFWRLSSNGCGGAVYNAGELAMEQVEMFECTATVKGNEIYNDGKLLLGSMTDRLGTGKIINAGEICAAEDLDADHAVNLPVENTENGKVSSGVFTRTITGGTIDTDSGKVLLVFTVNTRKKALIPAGSGILQGLRKEASVRKAYYSEGKQAVTEEDRADAADEKNRKITAEIGVRVSFETNAEGILAEDQILGLGQKASRPEITRTGYWLEGWYEDAELTKEYDFNQGVLKNLNLYAKWTPKETPAYRVTFETGDGTAVEMQLVPEGGTATRPLDPTREGYEFAGWFSDAEGEETYDFGQPVMSDLKLYAFWHRRAVTAVRVTFVPGNGEAETVKTVQPGETVERPEDPVRESYFFTGWYRDEAAADDWDFETPLTADIRLYAGWRAKKNYTVSFDSMGGSAVASQAVSELDRAVKPADPQKEKNTFIGWCTDETCRRLYYFTDPVTENLRLYALWIREDTVSVRIRFDACGGSEAGDQVIEQFEKAVKPADPVREDHTFIGWYTEKECTNLYDFDTPVAQDMSLYAGWEPVPVVLVHVCFEVGDGSEPAVQTLLQYEKAAEPAEPVRREWFFTGWYADPACTKRWDFDTAVEEDTELYAGWKAKRKLTVTFDTLGGSSLESETVLEQDPAEEPEEVPEKAGFVFYGWCTDAACTETYDFDTPVKDNLVLYARWFRKTVTPVTVEFESNGGSRIGSQILTPGEKALRPQDPVRAYYLFSGWFTDRELTVSYDFDTPVTEGIRLYAGWNFQPVTAACVTFVYQNGQADKKVSVLAGETVTEPKEPVKEGCFFIGWYADEACTDLWDFDDRITGDRKLYGGWRVKENFTVHFDAQGGTETASQTVLEQEKAAKPEDPVLAGSRFIGWCTDPECRELYAFETPVTGNLVLYAYWMNEKITPVRVEFDSAGGSYVGTQVVASGSVALRPESPSRKGYTFRNWLKGTEVYDFAEKVTENIRLVAAWVQNLAVPVRLYFDANGGSSIASQVVEAGSCGLRPEKEPTKPGYYFIDWYEDSACTAVYDFDTVLTEDRTVYAGWEPVGTFTFRFDSNGGSAVEDQIVRSGQTAVKPEDPTKEDCRFLFWCTDEEFTAVYDFSQPVTEDTAVYAKWLPKYADTVTIRFESNGGSTVDEQKTVRGETAVRPQNPVRAGYQFRGWYTDSSCKDEFDFSSGVTQDMILYAGWELSGNSGGGSGSGGTSAGRSSRNYDACDPSGTKIGTWKQDAGGWWIQKADGSWPAGQWLNCTWQGVLSWYYFTPEGYMLTGFLTERDGKRYYLHTAETGNTGAMAVGWVQIEKKWYYFSSMPGVPLGSMLVNAVTPDGYTVGADGAWKGF